MVWLLACSSAFTPIDSGPSVEVVDSAGGQDSATGGSTDTTTPPPTTPFTLTINEFMPANDASLLDTGGASPDWVELYNLGPQDVNLTGWSMSADAENPGQHVFVEPLIVPTGGFLLLYADELPTLVDHLSFSLDPDGGEIGLYAPDGQGQRVLYGSMQEDFSAARSPDGCTGDCWVFDWQGTPGVSNATTDTVVTGTTILDTGATWSWFDQGYLPSPDWHLPGFDDSSWPSGAAPLGYGDTHIVSTVSYGADAANKYITTWFRVHFTATGVGAYTSLQLHLMRDDGAVVYLNGFEVERSNMPEGDISASTYASSSTSSETAYWPSFIDVSALAEGPNVLAIELHQATPDSSDLGLDLKLVAY